MRSIALLLWLSVYGNLCISQSTLNNGLLACYPFAGNANDLSGNNHHGAVLGPILTTDRFGTSNHAYVFDGVDDFISIGSFSDFTSSNEFSISVWIQPNQVKLQTILFLMPDEFTDRFNAMAYYSHNGVSSTIWDFGDCTAGGRLIQVGTQFSNVWQHWVYTVNPGVGMRVYKDGVQVNFQTSTSSVINRQRGLWIGGGSDAAGAPFYFDGKIDDLRLYDRELTPSEVQQLYLLEAMCSPTSIAVGGATQPGYEVLTLPGKLVVKIKNAASETVFRLLSSSGQLLSEIKGLRKGDTFEITTSQFKTGVLLYSFQTAKSVSSGKVFNF